MSGSRPSRRLSTTPSDAAEYLDDERTIVAYLNEVLAEDDPTAVIAALGTVARARRAWQSWHAAQANRAVEHACKNCHQYIHGGNAPSGPYFGR